ncbi:helix-turn-helix domain-containing protein [Glycomyces salinus]|uniref:helix-turn-helix domain-containing protein n=1 Tax=Glycomyces salinus TaxID=980294 RepID=UPI0018ED7CFE|nr:helix-turn-helix transcriptional regulator [Glycomyces salinus]
MPRSERPLAEPHGELGEFALSLRELRHRSGSPTYRELAEMTGLSASTLWKAASGRQFPSLRVTLKFVEACGERTGPWRFRWMHLKVRLATQADRAGGSSRAGDALVEDDSTRAASAVAAELRAIVNHVRQSVRVTTLAPSQLFPGRERRRSRLAGSTRHLADVINADPGPAGVVSHVQIAKALTGDPRHSLDAVLVVAIVRACHEVCGASYTHADEMHWFERIVEVRTLSRSDSEAMDSPA